MNTAEVKSYFSNLPEVQQDQLLRDLGKIQVKDYSSLLQLRGDALDDKRSECPHCQSPNYYKNGKDKGSRKYKCKDCKRGFTEYTGTWVNGIHKKHLIPEFLKTLESSLSLIKSSEQVGLDPGTIFQWRHKFLSAQEFVEDQQPFKGITEVDETFYLHSQKGRKCTDRVPRNRGGRSTRGITNNEASVLTIMDRSGNSAYRFTNMGRISENDIEQAVGDRVSKRTILCSDGHNSYKSFANKKNIEHHVLNASKKERVKGDYHIQHINSLHSRMKTFFNYNMRGVSTKYIQKYLNWQRIKDLFKDATTWIKTVLIVSLQKAEATVIYNNIEKDYLKIYKTSQF